MASSFNVLTLFQDYPQCSQVLGKLFIHRPPVNRVVTPVSQGLRRLPFSVREEVSRENDEPFKSMTDDCVMEVKLDNFVTR